MTASPCFGAGKTKWTTQAACCKFGRKPEEAIMSLTDFGAIAGMLAVLGGIGCLMYFKYMKH